MAVAPNAQNLQVDSPSLSNGVLVRGAVIVIISANRSIGDVDVSGIDVDVSKEIFPHEMTKTLRVRGGKSEVFVEIKSYHAGKIERALLVKPHEMFVDTHHRAARRQSESQCRFFSYGAGDKLRSLAADFFVAGFQDNKHAASLPICANAIT